MGFYVRYDYDDQSRSEDLHQILIKYATRIFCAVAMK